ncbi:MAG: hypothetical protein ABI759_19610 [Candidatus Solibacter sp.]
MGLGLCLVFASSAQQAGSPAAQLAVTPRISVVSNIASACSAGVAPPALQQSAEEQLRGAGFTVSNIHNSELQIDVDCMAVGERRRTSGFAVHHCVAFSEMVSSHANPGAALLAGTWRDCQSVTCGNNCSTMVAEGQEALVRKFLGDHQQRQSEESLTTRLQRQAGAAQNPGDPGGSTKRVVIYSLYILVCLSVLFHWQLRKSSVRMF